MRLPSLPKEVEEFVHKMELGSECEVDRERLKKMILLVRNNYHKGQDFEALLDTVVATLPPRYEAERVAYKHTLGFAFGKAAARAKYKKAHSIEVGRDIPFAPLSAYEQDP